MTAGWTDQIESEMTPDDGAHAEMRRQRQSRLYGWQENEHDQNH